MTTPKFYLNNNTRIFLFLLPVAPQEHSASVVCITCVTWYPHNYDFSLQHFRRVYYNSNFIKSFALNFQSDINLT